MNEHTFEVPLQMVDKHWDPFSDRDDKPLSTIAANRIKRDLMGTFTDPPPGIFVVPDETNLRIVHVLIIGPSETPYEGGLFYFFLKCPTDYPMEPPKVKLMTTDAGRVRFNPNFYKCGKICVSILGTWPGPGWSPVTNISSLLLTIQSLMNKNPLQNEPDILDACNEKPLDFQLYNDYIVHETLRVAVCGMVENECSLNIPEQFKTIIEHTFMNYYQHYVDVATSYTHKNGVCVTVPYFENSHTFNFDKIIERLQALHEKISSKN